MECSVSGPALAIPLSSESHLLQLLRYERTLQRGMLVWSGTEAKFYSPTSVHSTRVFQGSTAPCTVHGFHEEK